ncbi:Uncharacterised protein [Yersinia pseudotuberculosis]|nr:Uncharacterised protein [Yersinia pseudotuberculosis]
MDENKPTNSAPPPPPPKAPEPPRTRFVNDDLSKRK